MGHPLDGCFAKIGRARELAYAIERQIEDLMADGHFEVVGENQPQLSRYAFWVEGRELPLSISVAAGEVIHHLRSALDHVIWALALTKKANPSNRIQFPVADTPKRFRDAIKLGLLDGVPQAAHAVIEGFQPYNADPLENSVLKILHAMDVVDKHRLLVVLTTAMRPALQIKVNPKGHGFVIRLPDPRTKSIFHRAIENGKEVQWIAYDPGGPDVTVENDFSVEVCFLEIGTLPPQPLVHTLHFLCNGIDMYCREFLQFF